MSNYPIMKPSLIERIDYWIWGDCEMCRMFRAGIFIGFSLAVFLNVIFLAATRVHVQ